MYPNLEQTRISHDDIEGEWWEVRYHWPEGARFAWVSRYALTGNDRDSKPGDRIELQGMRLCIIDTSFMRNSLLVAQDTWLAPMYKARYDIIAAARWINSRILWTLIVWDIVKIEPGTVPSWRAAFSSLSRFSRKR